jgi:hypothetical protein
MTAEQIQELATIENQLITFLATLPANDIKRTLSSAKKSLHSAICTALGDDVDAPEQARGK